jgi:hypothetical protein
MTATTSTDWFSLALAQINSDLEGALGDLTDAQVQVAKTAMVAAMRTTIAANPAGFREMLIRLAEHPQCITDAAERASQRASA